MAEQELEDSKTVAEKMAAQAIHSLDSQLEDLRKTAVVPYGVDLTSRTFYFGPETPTESSWEISGSWVEVDGEILVRELEVFPSRRIFDDSGEPHLRDPGSVPGQGLNRDIMRRLGTDAPIRRAIREAKKSAAEHLTSGYDESDLPEWGAELVEEQREAATRTRRGKSFDWWVARADEYLAVAKAQQSTYGVQAQLADPSQDDFWGVGIAGTRYRVRQLRERGLVDDTGPVPRPGPNHPKRKGTPDG